MAIRFGAPRKGLVQGLSPALPDFPADAAPDILNFRVSGGTWLTRKGMTPSAIIPGSGRTRLETTMYQDAARYRLGARGQDGAVGLYDLLQGTDLTYQPVLDKDGNPVEDLAGNPIHSLVLFDKDYLADQETQLRRYDPATRLCDPVTGLPKPSAPPDVRQTWFGFFEMWPGSAPYGWTESAPAALFFEDPPDADAPDFDMGTAQVVQLKSLAGQKGESVNKNAIPALPLNIQTPTLNLGLWFSQDISRSIFRFQWGVNSFKEHNVVIDPPQKNVTYIKWVTLWGANKINYFKIVNYKEQAQDRNLYLSGIVMPGRLWGQYRWCYTYYRPSTNEESSPSDYGPVGEAMEFIRPANYQNTTAPGLRRAAFLLPTQNPDREADDEIRWYQTGGIPALTADGLGEPIRTYLGTQLDFSTLSNGATLAGAVTMVVDNGTPFAPDTTDPLETVYQWAMLGKGGTAEEFRRVLSVAGNTLTFAEVAEYAHADNTTVQLGFLANVLNEVLATEVRTVETERDPPPRGIKWLARDGAGRMWAANFLEDRDGDLTHEYRRSMGIAVSNKPTPLRRSDHEVFPIAVDPYTTNSLLQGFRFDLSADAGGDEIMWFGIFQGLPTAITRQAVYRITSFSQADWNSSSVRKVLDRGCIAGDTVVELNGRLIWASDGPSIIAWDGRGAPVDISHLRIAGEQGTYLGDAPAGYEADEFVLTEDAGNIYWESWFARAHAVGSSIYYRLWMIPDDPLVARLTDLTLVSATTVSSAAHPFTQADVFRGLEIPQDELGWLQGLYRIESVSEAGVATLDRAIGVFGYGYPYETANAVIWEPFNSLRLDYDVLNDAWEPVRYYLDRDADGIGDMALGWDTAEVQYGAGDARGLFAAAWNPSEGDLWEQEVGLLDGEVPIKVDALTPRVLLANGDVATFTDYLLRLEREPGECDVAHLTAIMGGSEYPQRELCASVRLVLEARAGDTEIPVPFNPQTRPKGRWLQFRIQGDWSHRPALREFTPAASGIRPGRMTAQNP